jgi:NADPH:quinone reductase-like Zn-dependent oxidoreductase
VVAPARVVARRPRSIPLDDCAAIPLAGLTALQALRALGRVREGSAVLVNGASDGVGTLAVQIAKTLGARVTAVCSGGNADLVTSLGADRVVDYTRTDLPALSERWDVFFDAFGNRPFGGVKHLLTAHGVYVTTVPRFATFRQAILSYLRPGRKVRMVRVHADAADLALLARLVDDGRVRPVVDRRWPMAESAEAHRYLETRRARGKVLLIP